MYLLISDSYALTSERLYCNRNNVSFERIRQISPEIVNFSAEDIEEILIFAIRNTEGGLKVKTADCINLTIDETSIRVDYGKMQEYDETCINVRRRLYGNLVSSGRMKKNEFIPDIVLIDSIKDYNYIKVGKASIKKENQSWYNKVTELTQTGEWNEIIAMSPSANEIEKTDFWNEAACLSKLSFALSKLATKTSRRPSPNELKIARQYGEYFLIVINRCIELEPNMSMHKSSLAYYYYSLYMTNKKEEYFEKALPLYIELSETSNEKYKELYRLATIKRYHLATTNWDGKYTSEWFSKLKDIVEKYEWLIQEYQNLDEERQKKYKKYYIGSLFGYAKVNIDYFMKSTWDNYFNNVYAREEIKNYYKDDIQMNRIDKCAEYLHIVLELSPDQVNRNNIDNNPNYFELRYRLAQIEQTKGIILLMRGQPIEELLECFERSVKYADDVLNAAQELRNTGFRGFKFPDYVNPIKAISLFFLHEYNKCHRCFINAKPYMLFEEARIFVLSDDIGEAIRVLAQIPENDKCRNKANKLRDSLEGR